MGIKVDISGLVELRRQLVGMEAQYDEFCRKFLLQMGLRCLAIAKKQTPVDTGLLRGSWKIGQVRKVSGGLEIDIINPAEYASYLEHGHMTASRNTWVPGRFMLKLSLDQIEREMPARFHSAFEAWLKTI